LHYNGISVEHIDSSAGWKHDDSIVRLGILSDKVGIGTTNPNSKLSINGDGFEGTSLYAEVSASDGKAIYGKATADGKYGGYFEAAGNLAKAVYGVSTSVNGGGHGGSFKSEGASGRGVVGVTSNENADYTTGGLFVSHGRKGIGAHGIAIREVDGTNFGGFFTAAGSSGVGVRGEATNSSSETNYGGWFKAEGTGGGTGVYAWGAVYDFYADGPGTNYGSSSSRRWKKDIIVIDHPLDKVNALRGVYYNWDEEHGGNHDLGMIAEEVGEVLPEIVDYEKNGIDAIGMDYSKLTPLLVEAIKELNNKVELLTLQNAQYATENAQLNGDLERIEKYLLTLRQDFDEQRHAVQRMVNEQD